MWWPIGEIPEAKLVQLHTSSLTTPTPTEEEELVKRLEMLEFNTSFPSSPCSKGPCGVCGVSSKSRCGGCEEVFYCSKKHQQTDWSKHKGDCRSFSVPTQYPSRWRSDPPKYMVANKEIAGGSILFFEKPLLTFPNYPIISHGKNKSANFCCCLGCYTQFAITKVPFPLQPCKRCCLPLCTKCGVEGPSSHGPDECTAIAEAVSKNRKLMQERNEKLGQSASLVKDYIILKTLLLQKSPKWSNFLALKANPRYLNNLKNPTDQVKNWLENTEDFFISDSYLKGNMKDKTLKLEEIIRLISIFTDPCFHNPFLLILYELRCWIPHSCTPTAEFHLSPGDHTLFVRTVEHIKADGLISCNYMPNYDEGISKSAIRLWNKTRLFCAEKGCHCRYPRVDGSVGIKCSLFKIERPTISSNGLCPGFLAPLLEAPNPDKPSLGMLIYIKSKLWNCSKCKRSEKFSFIQKQVKQVSDEMKNIVEEYCKNPDSNKYSNLVEKLQRNIADQHWLWWKVNEVTIKCWNDLVGDGKEMLCNVVAASGEERKNFVRMVSLKSELYGDGIVAQLPKAFQFQFTNKGILTLMANRQGRLSLYRGDYLLDAFYANLILFAEDFKSKLNSTLNSSSPSLSDLGTETLAKWRLLIKILQEASISLREPVSTLPEKRRKCELAMEMVEVFQTVYTKSSISNKSEIVHYMQDFLEMYTNAPQPTFRPRNKDIIVNMFDPFGTDANLTFGPVNYNSTENISSNKSKKIGDDLPNWKSQRKYDDSEEGDDTVEISSEEGDSDKDEDILGMDMDDFLSSPLKFYKSLLNDAVKERIKTEKLLKNIFSSF